MRKALYLMYEGLPPSVIDSQVMTHIKSMRKYGIEFDLITFAHSNFLHTQALSRLEECQERSGAKIHIYRSIKPGIPFSEIINARKLKKKIKHTAYEFIHARTDYSAAVAQTANLKTPSVWDCRGDTLAESEEQIGDAFLARIKQKYKKWQVNRWIHIASKSDRANFVSTFLQHKYTSDFSGQAIVAGCAADEATFFFDQKQRERTRRNLRISNDSILFVYSGTIRQYQKVPETLALFERICSDNDNARMLILTPQLQDAEKLTAPSPVKNKIIIHTAAFEEMNAYLNAADYGFLLRDNNDINRAASPTKFAEYALTGLPVIHSKHIGDLDNYSKELTWNIPINFFDPDQMHPFSELNQTAPEERQKHAVIAKNMLGRNVNQDQFAQLYNF